MHFRKATKEDKATIMRMYREAMGTNGCTWNVNYPTEEMLEEDIARNAVYCIEEEGMVIASATIDNDEIVAGLSVWTPSRQPSEEIARVVTDKRAQGRGLAVKLIEYVMDELSKQGCLSLHFLVSQTNERALRCYEKLAYDNLGPLELYDTHWWCYEISLK